MTPRNYSSDQLSIYFDMLVQSEPSTQKVEIISANNTCSMIQSIKPVDFFRN